MATYTLVYRAVARNLSKTQLKTAWALIQRDPLPVTLGFTFVSDALSDGAGDEAIRTIRYTGAAGLAGDFENLNTSIFQQGLKAHVAADAVVVT